MDHLPYRLMAIFSNTADATPPCFTAYYAAFHALTASNADKRTMEQDIPPPGPRPRQGTTPAEPPPLLRRGKNLIGLDFEEKPRPTIHAIDAQVELRAGII